MPSAWAALPAAVAWSGHRIATRVAEVIRAAEQRLSPYDAPGHAGVVRTAHVETFPLPAGFIRRVFRAGCRKQLFQSSSSRDGGEHFGPRDVADDALRQS